MNEMKAYRLDACRSCRNTANEIDTLLLKIEGLFEEEDVLSVIQQHVKGELRIHHRCRVALAACPNGCSQPQIKDIGIIGAQAPMVTDIACTVCGACVNVCKEPAVTLDHDYPTINKQRCILCGQCMGVCPTGTIATAKRGFRVQLGGKLGRHPRLATELPGIFSEEEVVTIIRDALAFYITQSKPGERFADVFYRFAEKFSPGRLDRFPAIIALTFSSTVEVKGCIRFSIKDSGFFLAGTH